MTEVPNPEPPTPGMPHPGPLRTGSLRRRVTWSSIGVLVVALVLLLVVADIAFAAQSRRDLPGQVVARAGRAARPKRRATCGAAAPGADA